MLKLGRFGLFCHLKVCFAEKHVYILQSKSSQKVLSWSAGFKAQASKSHQLRVHTAF